VAYRRQRLPAAAESGGGAMAAAAAEENALGVIERRQAVGWPSWRRRRSHVAWLKMAGRG